MLSDSQILTLQLEGGSKYRVSIWVDVWADTEEQAVEIGQRMIEEGGYSNTEVKELDGDLGD